MPTPSLLRGGSAPGRAGPHGPAALLSHHPSSQMPPWHPLAPRPHCCALSLRGTGRGRSGRGDGQLRAHGPWAGRRGAWSPAVPSASQTQAAGVEGKRRLGRTPHAVASGPARGVDAAGRQGVQVRARCGRLREPREGPRRWRASRPRAGWAPAAFGPPLGALCAVAWGHGRPRGG